jgi:YHS domain-containing protein
MNRRNLLAVLAFAAALAPARSDEPASAVNVLAGGGVAIHGYDPVAYFTEGGPRAGKPELAVTHAGARWLFASEANRQRFVTSPARYLPAYGGYCAFGVAQGYRVKIDPAAFTIINERLYLNYDKGVQATWLGKTDAFIAQANTNWPRLVGASKGARAAAGN